MKLLEAQPYAILPSSLQLVEFIPNFTPEGAITIVFFQLKSKYLILNSLPQ